MLYFVLPAQQIPYFIVSVQQKTYFMLSFQQVAYFIVSAQYIAFSNITHPLHNICHICYTHFKINAILQRMTYHLLFVLPAEHYRFPRPDWIDVGPRVAVKNRTNVGLCGAATILAAVAAGCDIRQFNLDIVRSGELEHRRSEFYRQNSSHSGSFEGLWDNGGSVEDMTSTTNLIQLSPSRTKKQHKRSVDTDCHNSHRRSSQERETIQSSSGSNWTLNKPTSSHRRTASADDTLDIMTHKRTPSDSSSPSSVFSTSDWEPWSSPTHRPNNPEQTQSPRRAMCKSF